MSWMVRLSNRCIHAYTRMQAGSMCRCDTVLGGERGTATCGCGATHGCHDTHGHISLYRPHILTSSLTSRHISTQKELQCKLCAVDDVQRTQRRKV